MAKDKNIFVISPAAEVGCNALEHSVCVWGEGLSASADTADAGVVNNKDYYAHVIHEYSKVFSECIFL